MDATRRDFFRISTLGGAAVSFFGFDLAPAYAQLKELKIARAKETRSTCPYCAVGCGILIYNASPVERRTPLSSPSTQPINSVTFA